MHHFNFLFFIMILFEGNPLLFVFRTFDSSEFISFYWVIRIIPQFLCAFDFLYFYTADKEWSWITQIRTLGLFCLLCIVFVCIVLEFVSVQYKKWTPKKSFLSYSVISRKVEMLLRRIAKFVLRTDKVIFQIIMFESGLKNLARKF